MKIKVKFKPMRKLNLLLILVVLLGPWYLKAQTDKSTRAVIFEEDFNGWSSIEDEGWFTYSPQSWNFISATGESIDFFKQDAATWMMLISPLMDLSDASQLTFFHKRISSVDGQKLEVGVMTDPNDPATFQLLNIVDINNPDWTDEGTLTILSSLTGSYHIAFNVSASSPIPYTYFSIDNVSVTDDGAAANWPSYITNLSIEPLPNGANEVTVSWENPSIEADGDALTDLDSVVVLRNGEYLETFFNPTIGAAEEHVFDVPEPGFYVFTITAYNSSGASVPIFNEPPVWVGLDTPGPAENVVLTVTNNTQTTLTWTAPSTGAHGAYFDGVVDLYRIIRADGAEYTIDGSLQEFSQEVQTPGTYSYEVVGVNTSGDGTAVESNAGAYYFDGFLLAEDFWVDVPALGWHIEGESPDYWFNWLTDYAGGLPHEMIYYSDQFATFTGEAKAVSPQINTEGLAALTLKFKHAQYWLSGTYNFKVQTSSDGGNNWHDVWVKTVTESILGETKLIVIDNEDVGSENFQFSFVFEGFSENFQFMAMDEIRLYEADEVDLVTTEMDIPELIEPGNIVTPIGFIENWGYLAADFTATFTINNGSEVVYESVINDQIAGGGIMELTFDNWTAQEGNYLVTFNVSTANDENPNNNTIYHAFDVYLLNAQRTLVVCEEATGTWCGYCPGAAMGLDELVENTWPVAVVAYHGNDNYETPEGRQRIDFYGIGGYPTVMFDGVETYIGGSGSESMYNTYLPIVEQRLSIPAAVSIDFEDMIFDGNTLLVSVDINSGSPIPGDNIALIATLAESHIPQNWQGLNELNFVERAMFGGADGHAISLADQTENVVVMIEMDPEWVVDNSELVVYVQNLDNKEIYNGNKISLVTVSVNEVSKWVAIYPNPATDFITITNGEAGEVNLYTLQGQKVLSQTIPADHARIDVSGLEFGVYVLEMQVDGKLYTQKLLINN